MPEGQHPTNAQLNEFLDGSLNAGAHGDLQRHLDTCPICQGELRTLEALFSTLAVLPDLPLARDLALDVLAEIRTPVLPWRTARRAFWLQLVLALVILALSWPALLRWFGATPWEPALDASVDLIASWRTGVDASLTELGLAIETGAATLQDLVSLPLSYDWTGLLFEIWPWLGILGLVWLLINGAFLRSWGPGRTRRA